MTLAKKLFHTGLLLLATHACAGGSELATYTIQQGDSLQRIAQRYLHGRDGVPALLRSNKLQERALLRPGTTLYIPRDALAFQTVKAVVTEANCRLTGHHNGSAADFRMGGQVTEGDELNVPSGCRASLLLEDGSQVRLLSAAEVRLERLRRNSLETQPEVRLKILNGKLEADVAHREDGRANFRVATPTAMAGVRGTLFRVGYNAQRQQSAIEVDQGLVIATGSKTGSANPLGADLGQTFDAHGQPGPVEHLLPPPRAWGDTTASGWISAAAVAQANNYHLRRSSDLLFTDFVEEQLPAPPSLETTALSRIAVFVESSSISASGLQGRSTVSGVCRGTTGCDLYIDGNSLQMRHFRLQSNGEGQIPRVILDKDSFDKGASFIVSGLPTGQYAWQALLQILPERSITVTGTFTLFAVN